MKKIAFLFLFFTQIFGEEIYASFEVKAFVTSNLSLNSIGIVKNINYKIGDFVKKGEILLSLYAKTENIALLSAKNVLNQAELAKNFAQKTLNRYNNMKNAISKQAYDKAKFDFETANLKFEESKIAVLKVENLIENKILKAPFDGILSQKFVEISQGIASPNQPLLEFVSYPKNKIVLSFDGKFCDLVKVGTEFRYNINGQNFVSKIDAVSPKIDEKTRKITAEIYTSNLKIGIFGEGKIISE